MDMRTRQKGSHQAQYFRSSKVNPLDVDQDENQAELGGRLVQLAPQRLKAHLIRLVACGDNRLVALACENRLAERVDHIDGCGASSGSSEWPRRLGAANLEQLGPLGACAKLAVALHAEALLEDAARHRIERDAVRAFDEAELARSLCALYHHPLWSSATSTSEHTSVDTCQQATAAQ
jgi:hypothetical protein